MVLDAFTEPKRSAGEVAWSILLTVSLSLASLSLLVRGPPLGAVHFDGFRYIKRRYSTTYQVCE
ncbi:unnamed protein product [Laminaria digitata]